MNTRITDIQAYVPAISLVDILPFLVLLIGAVVCLVADALSDKEGSRKILPVISVAAILGSMGSFFFLPLQMHEPIIENTFLADEIAQLACFVMLFASLVVTIMAPKVIEERNLPSGEYYTLILFATLGMVLMATANELLTAFIALEIMSLSLYVLTGIDRRSSRASEASFKYFILGSFASAFLVFGIAFLFGATQTTYLNDMQLVFAQGGLTESQTTLGEAVPLNPVWVYMGFTLLLVGMCFKLSLAPFHMWAPDVYEGANTPATILIATGSKAAALILLVHIVAAMSVWPPFGNATAFLIGLLAVTSMFWGNLAALRQTNIKRMLAYSSVAHTGYMMVGILVLVTLPQSVGAEELADAQSAVRQALVLYLAGYTLMNILAFGIAYVINGEGHMAAYRGLVFRRPLAAFGMALAMFSLVGIGFTPPTIGFMGKFYLFKEAVQHGWVVMAAVAVVASVISAFYYLSLVVTMFMRPREQHADVKLIGEAPAMSTGIGQTSVLMTHGLMVVFAVLIFAFGIFPWVFLGLGTMLGGGAPVVGAG